MPKYQYRVVAGDIAEEVDGCIMAFSEKLQCEMLERSVRMDHVHIVAMIPLKVSVSEYVGAVKGRTATRVLNKLRHLKGKPYWGNHFWSTGTVWTR
jgi:putative transposase